jgi:transposase
MGRRQFSREFKLEAVRLVKERGISVVQASRDLEVGENVVRRWIKELTSDPGQAFPGQGQLKAEQQEIDRLRREAAKLKAERDILLIRQTNTYHFDRRSIMICACRSTQTSASSR